jgi:predicted PurR-regulated permease PerM
MAKFSLSNMNMRPPEMMPAQSQSGFQHLGLLVVVVAALYFGREVFIPLALALLLSFTLAPLVSWLRRRGLPRVPAVIAVVLVAFLAIGIFGSVVAGQVAQLAENLPRYQYNIEEKIKSIRSNVAGGGIMRRASDMLRDLSQEISGPDTPAPGEAAPASSEEESEPKPLPVEIRAPEPAPLEVLRSVIGPLIAPLATGGIVIVFVIFMLLQREDLRDRFIRLAGTSDLHRTTQAISEAGNRVARYLLMQLVVNATYGIPVGVGLWLIGVPNPVLWGMLALVLRFVPYIGPAIAALFPLGLSIAVDPGWSTLLWTAALFIVLELVSNNFVEPWLYGSSTGLSPLAIMTAAIFWTWLWGPIGLLLSTPLTVCLVVLGRHVQQFAFFDVLLGSEPVLDPHESLYQRLLAGDSDEAIERAEEYLEERPLLSFYEDVAIPALALVERDRARGVLDDRQRALVASGAVTLVDDLSEHEDESPSEDEDAVLSDDGDTEPAAPLPAPVALGPEWQDQPILCAGGRGNIDDAASAILAQLFERCGVGVRVVPFDSMGLSAYATLDLSGVRVVCLSFMNPDSLAHARYLVRRLRRRTDAKILVGFWSMDVDEAAERNLEKRTRADICETSLREAIEKVLEIGPRASQADASPQEEAAPPNAKRARRTAS